MIRKFTICLAVTLAFLTSCGQGSAGSADVRAVPDGVSALKDNEAYIIRSDLPLWSLQNNKLEWMENLTIGDKVIWYNQTEKHTYENAERDYSKVKTAGGKEGWLRSDYAVPKSTLAVVKVEKALVYGEPRDVKVTSQVLPRMNVVAVLNEGGSGDFVKVTAYDEGKSLIIRDKFLNKNDLSFDVNDVNMTILFLVAKNAKNGDIQKNLLTTALGKYASSQFVSEVQSSLDKLTTPAAKVTSAANIPMSVKEDNVNLRQFPDEVSGAVVGSLKAGQKVLVVEQTNEAYTVSGQTAKWYKISDPEGWVFGAFLTESVQ